MPFQEVYLDNSATTRVHPECAELMVKVMTEDYGNPSSMHTKGIDAEKYIRKATEQIAKALKCKEKEIVFTSCGTESDNLAIMGTAQALARSGKHLITTKIEHPAVLETMKVLEEQGYEVTILPVDEQGLVCPADLEAAIRPDTILVSVMHTNNEVGSLQPIEELAKITHEKAPHALFHCDAVQGFGKVRIIPGKMGIDLLSVSGHKIHAPKGVGFLYIREGCKVRPQLPGGGQQKGMRSGTENVPSVAALGLATEMAHKEMDNHWEAVKACKERFLEGLAEIPDVTIHGDGIPYITNASFVGIRSEVLLHALEEKGIYVSSGSACSSNHPRPSAVLTAMGVSKEEIDSALRFSFSGDTTQEQIDYTLQALKELVPVLRRFSRK